VVGENRGKVVQFFMVLHFLQQGRPMQEYEAIKPLSEFLEMQKNGIEQSKSKMIALVGQWHNSCIRK
jgi:hypothetical protein